ncbi:MAG TPA: TetR family transcriptional regulator [Gammaproteobacteria bacterium]|nr:TetR family transcriptional regulator [Gammaproteobacteria bacterium]
MSPLPQPKSARRLAGRAPRASRRPRAERTLEICRAAKDAFARLGYERATMADIAAAAGIAEPTIYKMFASKRELLYTVMAEWYASFTADLLAHLEQLDDPVQKLRYLIWHHLSIIEADPALCRVFFREVRVLDDYRGSPVFELNREYTAYMTRVIEEGIERGVFRAELPVTLVRDAVFGGLEHHAWQFLARQKPLAPGSVADSFCSLIVRGIARTADEEAIEQRLARLADRLESALDRLESSQS